MKRTSLVSITIIFILASFFAVSCDTGSSSPSTVSPFIGTWAVMANYSLTFTETTFSEEIPVFGTSSGTYTYDDSTKTLYLEYSVLWGSPLTSGMSASNTYTYEFSGNTLSLTDTESPEDGATVYTKQ